MFVSVTHIPLTDDSIKPQPSIPVLANEALATNFNLESISNGQVNDILVSDELPCITNEQIPNESESNPITAESTETTESTESVTKSFNIFDELSDVHINNVKCRRGRPKGSKKPFWSFSNSKAKSGKKRKAYDVLPNPSKVPKCQNEEQNAESPDKNNDKPNSTKIKESKEQPKTQIQSRKTIPACSTSKTKPNSIKEDISSNDKGNQMKDTDPDKLWLKIYNISLQQKDKNTIINKHMLNDKVIDAAQTIMKKQFNDSPKINGFQSAIFKQNTKHFKKIDKEMVQILHRGSADLGHWFTISTLNCNVGTINVFDSAFNDIDKESKSQIASILKFDGKCLKLQKVPVQHQAGGSDCGLFAIAFAVALCFGLNPSKLIFEQSKMRDHLLHCLKENEFTNFSFSINPMWKKKKIVINKETLFCFCRGLYDSEMAKCISCHEWFHLRCLSSREVKHIKDDVTFQYSCSKCLKS